MKHIRSFLLIYLDTLKLTLNKNFEIKKSGRYEFVQIVKIMKTQL